MMRIQVVRDLAARSAGGHRLANAPGNALANALADGRRATTGALAAAACGLAVTACASQGSAGAAPSAGWAEGAASAMGSPAAASIDACVTSQLKVSISRTGAIAGQAGGYLRFTNAGRIPCHMAGWPVVTGLTAAGTATPLRHAQSTMFGAWQYTAPPPVVTLRPGDSAYAVVAADDQPAGHNAHCPAPYVRLRVSPPGNSGDVIIAAWLPGAGSYLPACKSFDGSPTAKTSTITTLAQLAH
jgi:hypothetical protein